MPDIPAAASISAASSATTSSANNIVVETTVNNVPDKIQQLSRQIEVTGTLAEPPAGNAITLNTMIGPLMLTLPVLAQAQQDKLLQQLVTLFQTQRPLTVVMQPGNPPSQAFLLLPPATPASSYQSTAANFLQPSSLPTQVAPPLAPNATLSAVVLPDGISLPFTPPSAQGQIPFAYPNPNMGPVLNPALDLAVAKLAEIAIAPEPVDIEQPVLPNMPPQTPALPSIPNALNAPAVANAPATPAGLLQPGAELTLHIDTVIPPAAQGTAPVPVPQGNQVLATVTGNAPGGQAILKPGDATLFVRQPVDAPVGTQLLLTVESSRNDVAAYVTAPGQPQFPALQQIMAALQQIDPGMAHAIMTASMPQPGEMMPGALLFFLSIVRQGDVRGWLGNNALDMLARAGKAELIGKLAQELQQGVQNSRDNVVGEWRTYQVPLQNNNQLSAFYFHVHGDRQHHAPGKGGKDGGSSPGQMRFLIDVRMSRLGPLQLDGFLRQRQLDIIVRSENPLPPWLNQDLRQGYARTMDAIGYTGGLNFQNGRKGWLNIQRPAAGAAITT